jgi:hypothetical protein
VKKYHRIVLLSVLLIGNAALAASPATNDAARIEQEIITHRATQAMYWAMPAVSMAALRRGAERDLGARDNDVICFSQPQNGRHGFITANNETPYCLVMLDTKSGPVVMEIPPASPKTVLFGTAIDAWQVPLVDVGPRGADRGKGDKYVFLPPGYDKPVPEGYAVLPAPTFRIYVGLRPIAINGGTSAEVAAYSRQIRVYPLADAANPPETRLIDPFPSALNTLPDYDLRFFSDLATVVQHEPVQAKDASMTGMLARLGIEKGKPFAPGIAVQKTLEDAAKLGRDMLTHDFITPGRATKPYWPSGHWLEMNLPDEQFAKGFPFQSGDQMLIDERADFFHWLTFPVKSFSKPSPTYYLIAQRDQKDQLLDGKSQYHLRIPATVPVAQFWSVVAYDMKTKGFFAGASRVGISSYNKAALKTNADGSIDLYFGGNAPKDMEANWLPTGGDFFLMFRAYGPQAAFWDKSWTLPDVERLAIPPK